MAEKFLKTLDLGDGVKRNFLPKITEGYKAMEWIRAGDETGGQLDDMGITGIKYADGKFVATGGYVYISDNGRTWKNTGAGYWEHVEWSPVINGWWATIYDAGQTDVSGLWQFSKDFSYSYQFLGIDPGTYENFAMTPDGEKLVYFRSNENTQATYIDVCTANSTGGYEITPTSIELDGFVATNIMYGDEDWMLWNSNQVFYSSDGIEWELLYEDRDQLTVCFANGVWGLFDQTALEFLGSGSTYFPNDGKYMQAMVYFKDHWIIGGDMIQYSTDPYSSWEEDSDLSSGYVYQIVTNETICFLIASEGTFYSTDGYNWISANITFEGSDIQLYPNLTEPLLCSHNGIWVGGNSDSVQHIDTLSYAYEEDYFPDNNKILQVVNGEWQLVSLPTAESQSY